MADIQIRSFEERDESNPDAEPKKVFELQVFDTINGERFEHKKRYDVEPTNEQRAAFEGEAHQAFERQAKRQGVTVNDPGVTPAAQPVVPSDPGPASNAKAPKGKTAKKK